MVSESCHIAKILENRAKNVEAETRIKEMKQKLSAYKNLPMVK